MHIKTSRTTFVSMNEQKDVSFGDRLHYLLKKNKIKRYEFANTLGVYPSAVTRWIKGISPTYGVVQKMQSVFGQSDYEYLILGKRKDIVSESIDDLPFTISISIEKK